MTRQLEQQWGREWSTVQWSSFDFRPNDEQTKDFLLDWYPPLAENGKVYTIFQRVNDCEGIETKEANRLSQTRWKTASCLVLLGEIVSLLWQSQIRLIASFSRDEHADGGRLFAFSGLPFNVKAYAWS
jgi:hypothetical protein